MLSPVPPPQGAILTTMLVSRNFSGECCSLKRWKEEMKMTCHLITHAHKHTSAHSRLMQYRYSPIRFRFIYYRQDQNYLAIITLGHQIK